MKKKLLAPIFIVLTIIIFIWLLLSSSDNPPMTNTEKVVENWLCPMHPQVSKNQKSSCPICGMNLVLEAHNIHASEDTGIYVSALEQKQYQIEVLAVKKDTLSSPIELWGKVKVNPNFVYHQSVDFSARIEKLNISYKGQHVKKNEILAMVYAPEILTAQKELIQTYKERKFNPVLYQRIKSKFLSWNIPLSIINKIQEQAKLINPFPIHSQASGVIQSLDMKEGNYLNKGTTLVSLFNEKKLWAELEVYPAQMSQVKLGATINISPSSIHQTEKVAKLKVDEIHPFVDPVSGVTLIRATLENNSDFWKAGMEIVGKIIHKKREPVLIIPKSALLWTGKQSYVYVMNPEDHFHLRPITIGYEDGAQYVALKGLKEGEFIVSQGVFKIDASSELSSQPSMMHPHNQHYDGLLADKNKDGLEDIAFEVSGNCGMCKQTIEEAALSLKGVKSADWDMETKKIKVTFDQSAIGELDVHTKIAQKGYKTNKRKADKKAYKNLPACCKYDDF